MTLVSEKHLLLARNLTTALDRYANDTKAVFDFFAVTIENEKPSQNSLDLARKIGFRHVCLVDESGRIAASWNVTEDPHSLITPQIVQGLKRSATGQASFSAVMRDRSGKPTIFISRKLASGYIAAAALDLNYIRTVQNEIAFGNKGHSAIVDQYGNVIAHPNQAWQREARNIANVKPIAMMMAGRTGVATFFSPAAGKEMITGFKTVPGTGWGVMVPQPMEELEARAEQVRQMAFGIIAIGLVAASIFGWLLAGILVRPVTAVARAACEIAQGNLDIRVPANAGGTPAEYRQLGCAFNGMAQDFASDIVEREQAATALQESEENIRTVLDAMPVAIAFIDADGCFAMVNKKVCDWNVLPEAAFIGKPVEEVIGTRFQMYKPTLRKLLLGKPVLWETSMTYPDGVTRYIRANVKPNFGADNAILGWFVMIEDISESKRVEAALTESEQLLRGIFENSPSAILLKDREGRYQMVNQHYAAWYGLEAKEWQGKTVHEIYPPEYADRISEQDQVLLDGGEQTLFDVEFPFPDGTTRSVIATKFLIPGANGEPAKIGSIITDVTARRDAEASSHRVPDRAAVSKLTGGIAHEFNNLLGIVIGNLDLLSERLAEDEDPLKFVASAMSAALRSAELNHKLLAYSQNQLLVPEATDLGRYLTEIRPQLQQSVGAEIHLETKCAYGLWPCQVDGHELENVLVELAKNARHAMPDGGELSIRAANVRLDDDYAETRADVAAGDYVLLSVTDSGAGIAAKDLAAVFDPFFTTQDVGEGSGLGLSMVCGFAGQSGGDAAIESAPGRGTTVRLFLPRPSGAPDEIQIAARLPELPEQTVLVVESNAALRFRVVRQLRELGYVVLNASEGEGAHTALEYATNVDLLITGLMLDDGMSGAEVAAMANRKKGIKALYLSGSTKDTLAHFDLLDDDALLLQPSFSRAELADMVRKTLAP